MGMAFTRMQQQYPEDRSSTLNPIKDYFVTHPSLNIRAENWSEKAKRWKLQNPQQRYYIGIHNYVEKMPRSLAPYPQEWSQGLLLEKQN
jgi:predicted Zn-dependent protease